MPLERWGWYSLALNVVLAALHAVIAWRSGSLAVAAELTHNVVDLLAAVAVLAGLRLASRRPKAFPYGLYKVESVIAAVMALLVFVTAWEILRHALGAPVAAVQADAWMLVLLLATMTVPLVFSQYELRAGRAANSPVLIADAKEYRMHVFTTGLALAALSAAQVDLPLDRVAAAIIVVAVVKTGWDLLRDAMRVLLDASLDADTLAAIRRVIEQDAAVSELKWITGRNAGRYRFVEAGVVLRVSGLDKAEAVTVRIERGVRAQVPHVERVLLHIEQPAAPLLRYAVPLADREGTVSAHFGEAPYFALVDVRRADGVTGQQRIAVNEYTALRRAKGIRVAEWLVGQKVDAVASREDLSGKGPAYVLRDAGIEVIRSNARTLQEAIGACNAALRGSVDRQDRSGIGSPAEAT